MQRKVIKQGNGSYTITLPKKWVNLNGIEDVIDMQESSSGLVLSSKDNSAEKEITITESIADISRLRTILSTLYRRTYTKVILSKNSFSYAEIVSCLNSLQGALVIDYSVSTVHIQFPKEKSTELVESTINRMFFLTKMILQEEQENKEDLKKEAIKLRDYAQRLINNNKYGEDASYEYNSIIFILEKLCSQFSKNDSTPFVDIFDALSITYRKKDLSNAINVNSMCSKLRLENGHKKDAVIYEWLFALSSRLVGVCI